MGLTLSLDVILLYKVYIPSLSYDLVNNIYADVKLQKLKEEEREKLLKLNEELAHTLFWLF